MNTNDLKYYINILQHVMKKLYMHDSLNRYIYLFQEIYINGNNLRNLYRKFV